MLSQIKSTAKSSFIYGIGNLSTKLIGLILLPFYTRVFPVGEFGMITMLETTSQVLITFFGLSLYNAFLRWYWEKEYLESRKSLFFTVLTFLTCVSIIMAVSLAATSKPLAALLLNSRENYDLIRLMVITAAFEILGVMPLTLMRVQERPGLFISANIIKFSINLALTLFFIAVVKTGIKGIYVAQIIGNIVFFLYLLKYILKNIEVKFNRKALREMLSFSMPLFYASIAGIVLSLTDRYALKFIKGLDELGSYQFGYKIANAIKVIVLNSVNFALTPVIYKMIGEDGSKRFYSKILTYMGFGVMLIVLAISFYGKELAMIFARDQDYLRAYTIIPILSFGLFFSSLKDTVYTGLNISKKTKIVAAIIITVSVLNIPLNIAFIYLFSSMGAAIATSVSQLLYLILVWKYSQKYYYIPFEISKILKIFITGAVLSVFAAVSNRLPLVPAILIKFVLFISFPFILYFWNFFEPIELDRLHGLWLKWKNPAAWKKNIISLRKPPGSEPQDGTSP
jgi:O-antigen/teichoic acid export membrane protein